MSSSIKEYNASLPSNLSMWLWVFCMLFTPATASSGAQIRLVPGSYESGPGGVRGRLEIFHAGQWGSICNKKWTWAAQNVACQQLGYIRAIHHRSYYAYNDGHARKVWLSDVKCKGNETSFMDCALGTWGEDQCDTSRSDAGIWCLTQPVRSVQVVGCYSDSKDERSLKDLYSYLRHEINWKNLWSMVEKCAEGAVAKGYRFFGVQFFGECWGEAGHNPRVLRKTPVTGYRARRLCPLGVGDQLHNMIYELAPWENRGCWKDKRKPRAMTLLKNMRNQINWFDMLKTVRQCYNLAKAANYTYFSIQYYGECWASMDDGYSVHGPSSKCWSGVGMGWANNVYKILW